jgi:peroxiredoxin
MPDQVNMRDLTAILAIVLIVGGVMSIVVLSVRDAEKVRAKAQELIANPVRLPPGGERVFRKPKLFGYMLILFFIGILGMATYSVIHSTGLVRGLGAGVVVLLAISPLVMGVRSLRYSVRVSNNELTISDLTTKSVPLRDIGEVTIGVSRASSFCQIRLITGEDDLNVASDLEHFPEFVSLLSESVNASKTGS